MTDMLVEALRGRQVVGAKGRVFGAVEDLEFDPDSWKVTFIQLRVDNRCVKDLGLSKPLFRNARVRVPVSKVGSVGDVLLMKLSLEEFALLLKDATA